MRVTDFTEWTNILKYQPQQGQRILAKALDGSARIVTYDRFDYSQWNIKEFKDMPIGNGQRQSL